MSRPSKYAYRFQSWAFGRQKKPKTLHNNRTNEYAKKRMHKNGLIPFWDTGLGDNKAASNITNSLLISKTVENQSCQ